MASSMPLPVDQDESCQWERNVLGVFETNCGILIDEYDPNGWKFCPFCGHSIEVLL